MKKHRVDLKKTGQFSSFFLDYIEGKDALRPFYTHRPALESFQEALAAKQFSVEKRNRLNEVLQNQYEGLVLQESVQQHITALREETTFTVTTGHQLNLFTGPLYFIYKLISVINLAKKLQVQYPAYRFVPIYWMATEDHDFAEINYFKLDGVTHRWETDQKGAVGDFALDAPFQTFLKSLPFAPPLFKEAYTSSATLSQAVRRYVNELFGAHGLVVVDGHDARLKQEFVEVMRSDLFDHRTYQAAAAGTQALEAQGYAGQVFPREINLFYLDKGLRERIVQEGEDFVVLNTSLRFSKTQISKLLEEHPERFSPNVILRPLYQEQILPNLAYIGGPAEVVYWLQLKGVFGAFQTPFPVLMPRNFALVLDGSANKKRVQLDWSQADLFQNFADWKKAFVQASSAHDFSLAEAKEAMHALFDGLASQAAGTDAGLQQAFAAGKVRSEKILSQMGTKLRKAEERKLQVELDRAKELFAQVTPGGSPQERVVNFMQFYLGRPDFLEELMGCFDPFDFSMLVLELE
jgi:bacillithiol biosynthesis cysteine-adding enzyme BshC